MGPALSVIMTVYNGEPYLREAISSLLAQTYRDFELVVVNNGSTDGSEQILRSFNDPRMRIISLPRMIGRTAVLNVALEAAQGELVAVQDADDISLPERLEIQMAHMQAHPELALLGTWYEVISQTGEMLRSCRPATEHEAIVRASADGNIIAHSSVMYRRLLAEAAGGYPGQYIYAQDFGLWLRLMRTHTVAIVPRVLVLIREHPGQATWAPEYRLPRQEETVKLLRFASSHPYLSGRPKSSNLARSMIIYAQALAETGRHGEALVWLARFFLVRPELWLTQRTYWWSILTIVLGARGMRLASTIKRLVRT